MDLAYRPAPKVAPTARVIVLHFGSGQRCSKHPRYRVLRRPRAACPACHELWALKEFTGRRP